eukprot:CCRYP_016191-RB/>CCRYP_016191-RB protein AED:0.15 eAED:0.15 QI:280/1/1/1/0/0/3/81/383
MNSPESDHHSDVVRSPLRFIGPYPTIPLRFPHLATSSQRTQNVTGVSLDFILDTAANTNTINEQVAKELNLRKVGEAAAGVGAAGRISGGVTYLLGDCELDLGLTRSNAVEDSGSESESESVENTSDGFVFMKGLTASALPVASPAAAGLLSLAFFYCFEGGVEFSWGQGTNASYQSLPSVTFFGSTEHLDINGLTCIPFESLPVSMLPAVTLSINNVEIPALFDTGSPITVLNAKAAEAAGISTSISLDVQKLSKQSWNPLSNIADNIKSASEIAQATSRGDVLTIAGMDGKPIHLIKSQSPVQIMARAAKLPVSSSQKGKVHQNQYVKLAKRTLFVGDLPGLSALGGLGGDTAPPAAVLGMDVITLCPRVVFRAQQKEIYL